MSKRSARVSQADISRFVRAVVASGAPGIVELTAGGDLRAIINTHVNPTGPAAGSTSESKEPDHVIDL